MVITAINGSGGSLGDTLHASGEPAEARRTWRRALEVGENLPHSDVEHPRVELRGS